MKPMNCLGLLRRSLSENQLDQEINIVFFLPLLNEDHLTILHHLLTPSYSEKIQCFGNSLFDIYPKYYLISTNVLI